MHIHVKMQSHHSTFNFFCIWSACSTCFIFSFYGFARYKFTITYSEWCHQLVLPYPLLDLSVRLEFTLHFGGNPIHSIITLKHVRHGHYSTIEKLYCSRTQIIEVTSCDDPDGSLFCFVLRICLIPSWHRTDIVCGKMFISVYTKCSSTSYSSCEILTCIFLFLQPGRHSRQFFSSVFVCASVRLGHNFIIYRHILHLPWTYV